MDWDIADKQPCLKTQNVILCTHFPLTTYHLYSLSHSVICSAQNLVSLVLYQIKILYQFYRFAFAIGGQDGSEILSAVERYDPHTNAWILVAPLAIPLRFMTSISYRGKLYVFGGETTDKISKTAYRYILSHFCLHCEKQAHRTIGFSPCFLPN